MKIEKLTDNKIRIIVNIDELEKNNLNFKNFMMNDIESQKFFLDILNKAEKEVGFKTKDCRLLIETFSSLDETFVFTITKYTVAPNHKATLKYKKKKPVLRNPVYRFASFEEFCNLCIALHKSNISLNGIAKNVSLFLYDNTYFLVFSDLNLSYKNLKKLFILLSEFASVVKKSRNFEAKLVEYGQPIIKQNAFKIGIKYFS